MQTLINVIIGFIVALIVKFILDYLGVPNPLDWVIALVAFLVVGFGADRWR